MRISDWSSDVCSSDLLRKNGGGMDTVDTIISQLVPQGSPLSGSFDRPSGKSTTHVSPAPSGARRFGDTKPLYILTSKRTFSAAEALAYDLQALKRATIVGEVTRSEEHTSELQSLMRISYAVFCLKKKTNNKT